MNVKLLLVVAFSALSTLASAQENNIKVYSNFLVFNSDLRPRHVNFEKSLFAYNNLSIAYQRRPNDLVSNEFELYTFLSRAETESDQIQQFDIHLRYEWGYYFPKLSFNRGQVMMAGSWKLFYLNEQIDPKTADSFPITNNRSGLQVSVVTRLEYALTDRIFLDVNYNFFAISVGFDYAYVANPALPENERTTSGLDFDMGGERLLRVGVGFRLNKPEVAEN